MTIKCVISHHKFIKDSLGGVLWCIYGLQCIDNEFVDELICTFRFNFWAIVFDSCFFFLFCSHFTLSATAYYMQKVPLQWKMLAIRRSMCIAAYYNKKKVSHHLLFAASSTCICVWIVDKDTECERWWAFFSGFCFVSSQQKCHTFLFSLFTMFSIKIYVQFSVLCVCVSYFSSTWYRVQYIHVSQWKICLSGMGIKRYDLNGIERKEKNRMRSE